MEAVMDATAATGVYDHFARNYELQVAESYALGKSTEELHQFPARLEEGERSGLYLRVMPAGSPAWIGFFAQGFESSGVAGGIYSCPDPGSLCAVVGGYAYVVCSHRPQQWLQIEQRPVVRVKPLPELKLLVFIGLTSISGLGESGSVWTTTRLSWEGLSIGSVRDGVLHGMGWDMITDTEVPFEVDLLTGTSKGGVRPQDVLGHG
jgi:hypothetical protein